MYVCVLPLPVDVHDGGHSNYMHLNLETDPLLVNAPRDALTTSYEIG